MIGTVFLWMYWPSFNGALAGDNGNARHRCIINTTLSISSGAFWAFVVSRYLRKDGKFSMVDVQNATLAGGVAMGCSSNMLTSPWGAMFIGSWAGILSTVGFNKIQPYLAEKWNLHDTCGIHNLHGMPSVWGAFCSVVVTAVRTHAECELHITLLWQMVRVLTLHRWRRHGVCICVSTWCRPHATDPGAVSAALNRRDARWVWTGVVVVSGS